MNVNSTNQADKATKTKVVAGAAGVATLALGTALAIRSGKHAQAADTFEKTGATVAEKGKAAAEAAKEKVVKPLGEKLKGAMTAVGGFFKKVGKVIAWPFQKAWQGIKFVANKISGLFSKKGAEAAKGAAEAATEKVTEGVQSLIG